MIDLRLLAVEETRQGTPADRAAALRRCCGHVEGTPELVERGFRFYPMPGGDLPHFFCKRLELGNGRLASLTVLAGIDTATGEPVLEDCRTTADAREALAAGPAGTWLVRLMVGNATVAWPRAHLPPGPRRRRGVRRPLRRAARAPAPPAPDVPDLQGCSLRGARAPRPCRDNRCPTS